MYCFLLEGLVPIVLTCFYKAFTMYDQNSSVYFVFVVISKLFIY